MKVVVVGAGWFGIQLSLELRRSARVEVTLVEREVDIMTRASGINQARIHNGLHYPRSFRTARRSQVNMQRFITEWSEAVKPCRAVYAIARDGSKVSPTQFVRFGRAIGAEVRPVDDDLEGLVDPRSVSGVYETFEPVCDLDVLRELARERLAARSVELVLGENVIEVHATPTGCSVVLQEGRCLSTDLVLNCTYADITMLGGAATGPSTPIRRELAEMSLVRTPPALRGVGVTVMDGPFFSALPSVVGHHTLSHVRYTPLGSSDRGDTVLDRAQWSAHGGQERFHRMRRDVARFVPCLADAELARPLVEVKATLARSEQNDSRPVLVDQDAGVDGLWHVLGGKLDNVYDVLPTVMTIARERGATR